jgi:hypothetical protein
MLDKGLRDMLVAEYEPEHNRVRNVKVVKRLYIHEYSLRVKLGLVPIT